MQQMLLNSQRAKMLENGRRRRDNTKPVVKLFCPWGAATWLLSEIDPDNPDIAFGLCDLGMGCPELGSVSLSELRSIRHRTGLYIERDMHFRANKTLAAYAADARARGRIAA